MNGIFHAAAGVAVGGLALGGEATRTDLALCAVAGTSPDWDSALLIIRRSLYPVYHRTLTHGFAGLLTAAALAGAVLAALFGWDFYRAAALWLAAAAAHTGSDLFNRSGVALNAPFSWDRLRFPAVSWADKPLTFGSLLVAAWIVADPGAGRTASLLGLVGYTAYLAWRLRRPKLSDPVSRWWFQMVNPAPGDAGNASSPPAAEDRGTGR